MQYSMINYHKNTDLEVDKEYLYSLLDVLGGWLGRENIQAEMSSSMRAPTECIL